MLCLFIILTSILFPTSASQVPIIFLPIFQAHDLPLYTGLTSRLDVLFLHLSLLFSSKGNNYDSKWLVALS